MAGLLHINKIYAKAPMITIKTRKPFLYLHLTLVYGIDFCNSQLLSK